METFRKKSTAGQIREFFFHSEPVREGILAGLNRKALLDAIHRAAPGEEITVGPGDVRGLMSFTTGREAYWAQQLNVGIALHSSAFAAAVYTAADVAGAKPETKENLTFTAAAVSDLVLASGMTVAARQANKGWSTYRFGPQLQVQGAPVETEVPTAVAFRLQVRAFGRYIVAQLSLLSGGLSTNERGPVLSGVLNTETGEIFYGLNQKEDIGLRLHPILQEALTNFLSTPEGAKEKAIENNFPGSHAEITALNKAFRS